MLSGGLPNQVDVRKLASQGAEIKGILDVAALGRLSDSLVNDSGQVVVELDFGVNGDGVKVITGKVSAEVTVVCQRCLGPVVKVLMCDVGIGIVWDDKEAAVLSKLLDPLIVDEEPMVLKDIIEEELLLGLPFVSYHETDECEGLSSYSSNTQVEESVAPRENPFNVLKKLKGNK